MDECCSVPIDCDRRSRLGIMVAPNTHGLSNNQYVSASGPAWMVDAKIIVLVKKLFSLFKPC